MCLARERSQQHHRAFRRLVEPEANIISMVKGTVGSIFSVILCIFIGPWSDRFGRKPVLVVNLIGFATSAVLVLIYCLFDKLSPWYLALCSLPETVTGSFPTFFTMVLSYISDTSTEENRAMRMVVFEAIVTVGSLLGSMGGPYIFYMTSYQAIFGIAAICHFIALLYTWFLVPESVTNIETENKIKEFFVLDNVKDMMNVAWKKREHYKRAIIILCVGLLTVYVFIINGSGLTFQYLREKFGWTMTRYSVFISVESLVSMIGSFLNTYFLHTVLKVTESVLVLVGCVSLLNASLLMALATSNAVIYSTIGVRNLGSLISPMARTMVSKMVSQEEVGKVFALINASEFLISLGAGPLYTLVYNETINTDPGAFNFLSASLFLLMTLMISAVISLQLKSATVPTRLYEELVEETEQTAAASQSNVTTIG
ncbi:unnamed protein product [Callosobruchus maculatus]|uniref:Major facilitator superfamily (MFS) profile domain-containing protein n=1 Tax=Callosobruchus maculatus TaxID=64391 RepID=A0A653DND0_CALMS|nr:unnamed protein product [Callosobruchus maculatus]